MKKEKEELLEDKLSMKLRQLPDFAFEFISYLGDSKEIQTRLEYVKDIQLFLEFIVMQDSNDYTSPQRVTAENIASLEERDFINFFQYLTKHERRVPYSNGNVIEKTYRNSDVGKARKLATLRKLFAYLEKRGYIEKNPIKYYEIKVKKKERINTRLTSDEIQRFFSAILNPEPYQLNERETLFHNKVMDRNYVMALLLAYTGIRVSELIQLDINDVMAENDSILITRKGGDQQILRMPTQIVDDVRLFVQYRKKENAMHDLQEPALFVSLHKKRIDAKTVRAFLSKYQQMAEIDKKITPHVFRRTFGTNHYNTYKDMYLTAQVLGHQSAETTRKFYADPNKERVEQSMQNFSYGDAKPKDKLEEITLKYGLTEKELMALLREVNQ